MDFKLFRGVIKRYKRVVIPGVVLAVVLSVLSYGTPGFKNGKPAIIPSGSEVWQGNAVVLISQAGFPYDRAVQQVIPGKGLNNPPQTIGDLSYMSNLSSVYAAMANGDSVQQEVARDTHVPLCPVTTTATAPAAAQATGACGTVVAATLQQQGTGSPLPMITLTSSAPTARQAGELAATAITVLRTKISQEQATASTPVDQRVELQTVNSGAPATLAQGPSKSVPILILFAVVSASIALAFILNNHSENPVRSTRRRLDEGLNGDAGLAVAGAGNGHVAEPDYGLVHPAGRRQLIGLRRPEPGARLASDKNGGTPRVAAEGSSSTDERWARGDRTGPHFPRGTGSGAESHD